MSSLKIIFESGLYVTCDKYEFIFPVFQLLPDCSTYCELKSFAINPQCMTLLVKIMLTIVEKIFFTLTNVLAVL